MNSEIRKVRHAFIAPTNYLHLVPEESKFHLLLAHLMDNPKYTEFYRKRQLAGDFIIIDNGAFEKLIPMNVEEYYKIINDSGITPDVVVASDYPGEPWEKTVNATMKFVQMYDKYFDANKTNIMAVPQSEKGDWKGWIKAYSEFALVEDITFIGMSILGIPNAFCSMTGTDDISTNRIMASLYMKNNNIIADKHHHYLGCGNPRELLIQKEIGIMYSNDSSTAFWSAINGKKFDRSAGGLIDGKVKREVDFNLEFDDMHTEAILHNIKWMEDLLCLKDV